MPVIDPGLARSEDGAGTSPAPRAGWTHRRAALLLCAALLACFVPRLARDEVLYPHDNAAEVGLVNQSMDPFVRAFGDQCQLYVPEIHAHLKDARSGWLSTWNPHNELGRPLFPSGIGRGYVLGVVLSWLTSDALTYYTWWSIAAVACSAAFAFLFLRARRLHPLACLAGALGISIGPIFGAWQAVPLLQWGYAWALAALLGIEAWLRRPSWHIGAWIVFSVHSVLLTGFPQHVLMLGWIVASWLVLRTFEEREDGAARLRTLGAVASLALLGVLSVAPVWADLIVDWSASTRADYVASTQAWAVEPQRRAALWTGLVGVLWADDPGCLSLRLSPLFAGLTAVGLLACRRSHTALWLAWLAASLAGTLYTEANTFLRVLGLSFSEWPPVYAGLLPCLVLSAAGADRILRADGASRLRNVLACLVPFAIAALHLPGVDRPLVTHAVVFTLLIAAATLMLAARPVPILLLTLLGAVVVVDGQALVCWHPRAAIHTDSPLAAELRRRTSDGSRFAWVGLRPPGFRFLPPNLEIVLGLSSIHGYDHFMSRAFSDWSRALGTPAYRGREYERRFDVLGEHALLDEEFLAAAGVSTLVSVEPLDPQLAGDSTRIGEVHVASVLRRGPLQARLDADAFSIAEDGTVRVEPLSLTTAGRVERVPTGFDDRLQFRLEPSDAEGLLFVSQSFDGRWQATWGDLRLPTVRVNGLYQGVLLPAGVDSVELTFRTWSRHVRPIQIAFVLLGAAALVGTLRRRALSR